MLRCQYGVRGVILFLVLWLGACTGRQAIEPLSIYDQHPTEVDTEYNRLTSATRYQQPRQAQRYRFDRTEVDLAQPLEFTQ